MICLLITMTILISGIESAEHRSRHSETILSKEELDDRTKAWLLMVESGKVDEEQLRKITPKSVFIAPLISSRSGKCKEGYRHDHLGQCVKVIKVDPNAQLELLLKRLSAMYAEKTHEEEEDRLPVVSNGPLHFSIPISNPDTTPKEGISNNAPEMIPVPLPMLSVNATSNSTSNDTTVLDESSGFGNLENADSDVMEGSGYESSGYGSGSGAGPVESWADDNTSSIGLISDDMDYTEEYEITTTGLPPTEAQNLNQSYPSLVLDKTISPARNETVRDTDDVLNETEEAETFENDTVQSNNKAEEVEAEEDIPELTTESTTTPESLQKAEIMKNDAIQTGSVINENFNHGSAATGLVAEKSKPNGVRFPDEENRTQTLASVTNDFVRFPDQELTHRNYQPQTLNWNANPHLPSTISRQEFWWLPENWKVDEQQHKPTLVKFWSRLPLIHDSRFANQGIKPFYPSQQHNDFFRPSPRLSDDYTIGLNPPLPYNRRGRFYRNDHDFKESENTSVSL